MNDFALHAALLLMVFAMICIINTLENLQSENRNAHQQTRRLIGTLQSKLTKFARDTDYDFRAIKTRLTDDERDDQRAKRRARRQGR